MKREREKTTRDATGKRLSYAVMIRPATHTAAKAIAKEHGLTMGLLVSLWMEEGMVRYAKEGKLPRPPWAK